MKPTWPNLRPHLPRFDSIPKTSRPETLFSERGLALVAVPWYWGVALKVARYSKNDPDDCAAILHFARMQHGISPAMGSRRSGMVAIHTVLAHAV
jgi:hypothetical protein